MGKSFKRSHSEIKPEHVRLISVSPYRAVVKLEDEEQNDWEEDLEREGGPEYDPTKVRTTLSERKQRSPIKADSEYLRS